MRKGLIAGRLAALHIFVLGVGLSSYALPSAAQLPYSARSFPPMVGDPAPEDWMEKWAGNYLNQDQSGVEEVPRGYTVLNPFRYLDDTVIPLLTPWAQARMEATDFEVEESGQVCRPTGIMMAAQNRSFQLVVAPGRITTIGGGGVHTAGIRRIYLDRGHLKNPPLTSLGDSVGYWDGETLVVDTVGFDDKSFLSLAGTRHSTELHVVERWRLITVGDDTWIEKEWTVDDPHALRAPYKFTRYHKKLADDERPLEGTCLDARGWRLWVQIRNDAVEFQNESRAAAADGSGATR